MTGSVSFDRAAPYYDRTRAISDEGMARLVHALVTELPAGGRTLEVGVGTGRIALPLVRAGIELVGVDISRAMLARLRENAAGASPEVLRADATRLPFRSASFTAAIAVHVFHLIPEWKAAVAEVTRVVQPGGVLIASRGRVGDQGWDSEVRRRFFVEAGDPSWPPGIDRLEVLDAHLRALGASVRDMAIPADQSSATINQIVDWLEAGYASACWGMDEATRSVAAASTRRWASEALGDLDEPRPTLEGSAWHAYRLPQ